MEKRESEYRKDQIERSEFREPEKKPGWKNITPSHEKLWIWQKANKLHLEIYETCKSLPRMENYRLKQQIENSSKSVKDNIAEGNESYYFADKQKGLFIARKEAAETQNHLRELEQKGYVKHQTIQDMIDEYEEVKRGINGLIRRISERKESTQTKGAKRI